MTPRSRVGLDPTCSGLFEQEHPFMGNGRLRPAFAGRRCAFLDIRNVIARSRTWIAANEVARA